MRLFYSFRLLLLFILDFAQLTIRIGQENWSRFHEVKIREVVFDPETILALIKYLKIGDEDRKVLIHELLMRQTIEVVKKKVDRGGVRLLTMNLDAGTTVSSTEKRM